MNIKLHSLAYSVFVFGEILANNLPKTTTDLSFGSRKASQPLSREHLHREVIREVLLTSTVKITKRMVAELT